MIYHLIVESPNDYLDRTLELQISPQENKVSSLLIQMRSLDGMPLAQAGSLEITWDTVTIQGINTVAPNIPLFAATQAPVLQLEKRAEVHTAYLGDIIRYYLTLGNPSDQFAVNELLIQDQSPPGTSYVSGSTLLGGERYQNPEETGRGTLTWQLGQIIPQGQIELSYALRVGPDAHKGDGINSAQAQGQALGGPVSSNQAQFKIRVREGVFTSQGIIIGRVFLDSNRDGIQNNSLPPHSSIETPSTACNEPGIPGVHLYLENGVRVITDEYGKFSIFGVVPGSHVLRLDLLTLPPAASSQSSVSRVKTELLSQFVDVTAGELHQVNFPLLFSTGPTVRADVKTDSPPAISSSVTSFMASSSGGSTRLYSPPEDIQILGPTPAFLYPEPGAVLPREHTDVQVKYPLDSEISLRVNGRVIRKERIGQTIINQAHRVAISDFISVSLDPGANILLLQIQDQFGNLRDGPTIQVYHVGAPARIQLSLEKEKIPADGMSTTLVYLELLDQRGFLVPGPRMLTVETSAGQIEAKDLEPQNSGLQLVCRDGLAKFYLRSARKVGPATVTVYCEGMMEKHTAFFTPFLRPPLLVGIGEITIGYGHTKGNYLTADYQLPAKAGFFHREKLGFFFQGKYGEDKVLTLGYHSRDKSETAFFETLKSSDEQERYPVYGDSSKLEYETQSQSNLYAKLENQQSSILWGDYRINFSQMKLSQYRRTFNGLLTRGKRGSAAATFFASRSVHTSHYQEIRGQGISGYYYLEETPVIEGSEQISLETRDQDLPDKILSQRKMYPGQDYEIDYQLGWLMFKEPIPYEDAQGNPVFIVLNYQTDGGEASRWTLGYSAVFEATEKIRWESILVKEESIDTDFLIKGGMVTISPDPRTKLVLEAAETESHSQADETYQKGLAWRTEIHRQLTDKIHFEGHYQDVDQNFDNPHSDGLPTDTYQYRLTLDAALPSQYSLQLNHLGQREKTNAGNYQRSSVSLSQSTPVTSYQLSLISERSQAGYAPSNAVEDSPFSKYHLSQLTSARFQIKTKIKEKYSLLAQYQQALDQANLSSMTAGLDYQISQVTKSYLRYKRSLFPDEWEDQIAAGWESKLTQGLSLFQEYEVEGGINGQDNQHKIGLKSKFTLEPGLKGNLTIERVETLGQSGNSEGNDFLAVALGLEHLDAARRKWTHRLEVRKSPTQDTLMGELGVVSRLTLDYTLLTKIKYFGTDQGTIGTSDTWDASLGLAYRPVQNNRFSLLSKIEHKSAWDTIRSPHQTSYTWLGSLHAVYAPCQSLQLRGRYAAKLLQEKEELLNPVDSLLQLSSLSLIYDLSEKWDLGLGYQIIWGNGTSQYWQGYFAEIGYRLSDDWWLTAGYSYNEYLDEDLSGRDYLGHGPYLKLRFKFDETYLQ